MTVAEDFLTLEMFLAGISSFSTKVRAELPDGATEFYEGEHGEERLVRTEAE